MRLLIFFVSKYIDYYLQKLVKLVPSYVNRSQKVVDTYNEVGIINLNTRLLSSDAVNIYGNIHPIEVIDTIKKYFELFAKEYRMRFPNKFIIKLLRLAMKTNIFQFGNTWWLQKLNLRWEHHV